MPKITLQTKIGFNLKLSPTLKNSINLLSISHIELTTEINKALENNMLLTEVESKTHEYNAYLGQNKNKEAYELQIKSEESLFSKLEKQLLTSNLSVQQLAIAKLIIDNLDEFGFLKASIETIFRVYQRQYSKEKINIQDCEVVRSYMQHNFEPLGIASFNTQDFLLLQVGKQANIIEKPLIIRLLSEDISIDAITPTQKSTFLKMVKSLLKTPVDNTQYDVQTQFIQADASIYKDEGGWHIKLKSLPTIAINKQYLALRKKIKDKTLFNQHLSSARGLMSFIEYRNKSLQVVVSTLINKQELALIKGERFLKPLSQKEMALELNIGESTLSRLIKNKYIDTPIGTIKIQDLFSASVGQNSSKSVKQMIIEIIQQEKNALSDQKITDILMQDNINISRRTVTKYRKSVNISCARDRNHQLR